MTSATLSALLTNLGWGSGFRLPVANDENRALESLLEEKQRELLRLNAILESDNQHCQILKNHLDRVSKTVSQSQKMVSAKKTGIETENNILSIAERVLSRAKGELKTTIETAHDYHERNLRMANEVESRKRNVEELVQVVKFDRVALERYKEVAQEKENDIEYMATLNKLDGRISEGFQLKFSKAGEDLSSARKVLHEASMVTQSLQQRFNRLCSQFRRLHHERGQSVAFWENTLRSMKQRDDDIKEVAEEYADVRVVLQEVESQCERKRGMLEAEKRNTGHLDYQIAATDKTCVNFRIRLAEGKDLTSQLRDEILAYNTVINQTSRMVKDIQTKIQNHENELAVMEQKLEKATADLMEAKERYDMAIMDTMSEEAKAREYEKMIEQEEQRMEAIIQDVEKQRRFLWQRSNDMAALEQKIKSVMTQIKGTKAMIVALRDRARNDDIMIQKKRQQAYHLELECVGIEARIQNIISAEIDFAQSSSTTKVDVPRLREKLAEILKTKGFLTNQEAQLLHVNRRIIREIGAAQMEHAQLELQMETEKMESKRCTSDTQKALQELNNAKIEHRMLELDLKRLLRCTQEEREKLTSLEQDRLLLDAVAKERRAEIQMHMGLLKAQQKNLREERNRLMYNLTELLTEIERCKKRYEIIINAMNLYGEEGGAMSESHYILKHAQEKEMLKREGDLWDTKVKETEKEIAAMQNTLSVIVSSNMAFKESLAPAAADTPEAKMIQELEEEYRVLVIRKRKAEKRQKEILYAYQTLSSEISECKQARLCLEGMVGEKKYEMNNIHYEIANQKAKIDRASRLASRLVKDLGLHVHDDRELIEADLKLRCAREKFEFALKTLEKSLFLHSELRDRTIAFLEKTELEPLTYRLKRRIRHKDGAESPYYSGQVTPVRYLTPVSSTNIAQFAYKRGAPSDISSMKPATPPASLASKPGSASSKTAAGKTDATQDTSGQSEPEQDREKPKTVDTDVQTEPKPAKTTMLFKSDKEAASKSQVFDAGDLGSAEEGKTSLTAEEKERTSVETESGERDKERPSIASSVASSKPAEGAEEEQSRPPPPPSYEGTGEVNE